MRHVSHTHTRYAGGMRTNIVIDDHLIAEAQRLSGITTKREVVDEALREFVSRRNQAWILDLFGSNPDAWAPARGDDVPWLDD